MAPIDARVVGAVTSVAAVPQDRVLRLGGAEVARPRFALNPSLVLAPSLATTLGPSLVDTTGDASGAPLASSRNGNLFADGGDPAVSWYLPAYALQVPDPTFGFAAVQDGADAQGRPFNRATLTVGVRSSVPPDVQAAMQADPTRTFRPIPLVSLDATLTLSTRADDGSTVSTTVPGTVTPTGDDTLSVAFAALLGPTVLVAFSALTATGTAAIELRAGYGTVDWRVVVDPPPDDIDPPVRFPQRVRLGPVVEQTPMVLSRLRTDLVKEPIDPADPVGPVVRGPIVRGPWRPGPVRWGGRHRVAVHDVAVETYPLTPGLTYAGPSTRPSFTLTAGGQTHGIVSAQDLEEFDVHQSEYVELTSLGSVAARYPSLRALYLGQVSSTVLAIPAAYGVLRDRDGCRISCDAVVDTAPTSASGCRFVLTFTLAPLVDPGDLARLAADLATAPALAGRQPRLALPTDLDRRTAGTLSSAVTSSVAFGVGLDPDTFTVSVTVVDDDLPSVAKVNLLLAQLSADAATLLGRVPVRLDDAYPQTVSCDVVLNLGHTAGSTDVVLVVDSESGAVGVLNQSPLDLVVHEVTSHAAAGFTATVLDRPVPAAGSVALDLPDGSDTAYVDCGLDLPAPLPANALPRYVTIHAETVQQVHHVIGFNAAGQLDGIDQVSIQVAVEGYPDLAVPTIVLSPDHPLDSLGVLVPVLSALTGLPSTVALSVTPTGGGPVVSVSRPHDFGAHPIMVLTRDQLGPP